MTPPEGWVPEFEGQRPPFAPGNQLAVDGGRPPVHGAYSPRRVDPLARDLVDQLLADSTVRHAHALAYRSAVWAWARAEAQVQLLSEYLAAAGERAGDGVGDLESEAIRSAYLLLHRAESRAMTGRARLGLDPLSRARLGKDTAAGQLDTARLMAELEKRDRGPDEPATVDGEEVR